MKAASLGDNCASTRENGTSHAQMSLSRNPMSKDTSSRLSRRVTVRSKGEEVSTLVRGVKCKCRASLRRACRDSLSASR